ncbi:glycosyltransferase family 2 protein [Mycolicibacterium sediminis]|nr:galactosyltransferase-related protein [Mycolicibacterium sediminis]
MQELGLAASSRTPDVRCVVAMDDDEVVRHVPSDAEVVPCARSGDALPLARARNVGARRALDRGADLLVFLDVDCIPGATMLERYVAAHQRVDRPTLLAGPVTYLPQASDGYALDDLPAATRPHPARPNPSDGDLLDGTDHDLFWSLSFGASNTTWQRIGGFCEDYEGYGGEDTDFAATAASHGVALTWVGGAHAYHQHHPVSDPPVEHLRDIVANATVFRKRWGRWPMPGWLDEFERRGLIVRAGERMTVTVGTPPAHSIPSRS